MQRQSAASGGEHWSTHLLTEFLALVLAYDDVSTAYQGGVEHIAEALEAEMCAIVDDDGIVAVVGFPIGTAPEDELRAIGRKRPARADVTGLGECVTEVVTLDQTSSAVLVVGRMDDEPFTRPEMSLLRGMTRTLMLCIRMLRTVAAERSLRETSDVLLTVQRAIAQRAPLQEVLDAITQGARELLRVEIALLRLIDPSDPSTMLLVSSQGLDDPAVERLRHAAPPDGVVRRAVSEERLVTSDSELVLSRRWEPDHDVRAMMAAPVREGGKVIGAMAVATRDHRRRYDPAEQHLLLRFAEHASLALTDAHTVEQLSEAMYDPLTSLANRGLFLDRLQQAMARADGAGSQIALLFCDLDGFKTINDSLGHTVGDAVLRVVAERIRAVIRGDDTAARLGGDEFAVLLENVEEPAQVTAVGERLLEQFVAPLQVDGYQVRVGVSVGVVLRGPGREGADELLRNADLAMYRSKAEGRHRLMYYESWMHQRLVERVSMDNDLREALDADQFEVHYQPIVALSSGAVVGVEALARWRHPVRGMVSPGLFIPLAEETGLIHRLGEQVLRQGCTDVQHWRRRFSEHGALRLSVNVSAVQLHDEGLVDHVREVLVSTGLPPVNLTLEITESALMEDPHGVAERLRTLKMLGVSVAIDDFGTGYSSLSYLRQFPADVLKIDKVFVDDIGRDGRDGTLAEGIVGLARALGLDTVAEGIEDPGQADRLVSMGCQFGQGFALGRPQPAPALAAHLARNAGRADQTPAAAGFR